MDCRHRGSGWVDLARIAFRQAHPKHIADLYAGSGIPVCATYDSSLAAVNASCPAVQSAHRGAASGGQRSELVDASAAILHSGKHPTRRGQGGYQ